MAITQIKGYGISDGTIAVADFSATGTPSSTTYLRGDNTWATVTAAPANISTTVLAPAGSETVGASLSAVVNRSYKIASGQKLTLRLESRMRIL